MNVDSDHVIASEAWQSPNRLPPGAYRLPPTARSPGTENCPFNRELREPREKYVFSRRAAEPQGVEKEARKGGT
jgi:hypothetical protein